MTISTTGLTARPPRGRLAAPPRRPRTDGHPTCTCGQELDLCRHAHCPRCGHRLPAGWPAVRAA